MSNAPPLVVRNLSKYFGSGRDLRSASVQWAVRNISFQVNQSEILGLLGPNGAGKTTTIMMLISVLKPDSGTIEVFGHDLALARTRVLQDVAFASTYTNLPLFLSVQENLDVHGRLYSIPAYERRARIEEMLQVFNVIEHRHKRIGQLSAGQRTRVMLAKAFLSRPKLLLLDEPTASLDPEVALEVREFVRRQRNQHGTAVLFSSHNMAEVSALCDRVIFLKEGEILAIDTPGKLAASAGRTIIKFRVLSDLERVCSVLRSGQLTFSEQSATLTVETTESELADVMIKLAQADAKLADLSVRHPTLEDYFLLHSEQGKH